MKLRRAHGFDYQHTPAIKQAVEIAEKKSLLSIS